jgi:hypothetical protein
LLPALKAKELKNPGTFSRLELPKETKSRKKTTQKKLTQKVI